MKKSLLFVTTGLEKGGAEVALVNLLKNLDPERYEVDLLLTNNQKSINSLIDQVPDWICIYDANKEKSYKRKNFFASFLYKDNDLTKCGAGSLKFIYDKKYDFAFSYGEWVDSEFVAKYVVADRKSIWIHTDLSQVEHIDFNHFFNYFERIDDYIFVSETSMIKTVEAFPFLKEKCIVIHNMVDDHIITKLAQEPIDNFSSNQLTVVTIANIRREKNHLRQLEVFKKLSSKIKFKWINIGKFADESVCEQLKEKIVEYNVQKDFLLLGPKANPYPYIKNSDVVAVLSDYESWSLVLTEAKILHKPIIATKTSGAMEQIENGCTGILTDFSIEDIVKQMETVLTDAQLRMKFANNLNSFKSKNITIEEFESYINKETFRTSDEHNKDILFIFDSINYPGGAHYAMKRVVNYLRSKGRSVTIFSGELPSVKSRCELPNIPIISWQSFKNDTLFYDRIWKVLTSGYYSAEEKKKKIMMTLDSKLKNSYYSFNKHVTEDLGTLFKEYKVVCVISEGSCYREIVSKLSGCYKIQWVHTDYDMWRSFNKETLAITKNDGELYAKFDKIVFISKSSRKGFLKRYPQLINKTQVIYNLMPIDDIKTKSMNEQYDLFQRPYIITIGRLEAEKGFDRIIKIAKRLVDDKQVFTWLIVGDGSERYRIQQLINDNSLFEYIILLGKRDNPFSILKKSDIFALLSYYEGLPNTIFEALILGIPVIATNVGGISEQISHGENGLLVNNDEDSIYLGLKELISNEKLRTRLSNNLNLYSYNNKKYEGKIEKLFRERGD